MFQYLFHTNIWGIKSDIALKKGQRSTQDHHLNFGRLHNPYGTSFKAFLAMEKSVFTIYGYGGHLGQ